MKKKGERDTGIQREQGNGYLSGTHTEPSLLSWLDPL
jgi:hypothetical protein